MIQFDIKNTHHQKIIFWNGLILTMVFYAALSSPLDFVFNRSIQVSHLVLDAIFTTLFSLDIYFRFKKKYQFNELNQILKLHKEKKYINSWEFPLDIVSSIPFDIILYFVGFGTNSLLMNSFRLLRLVRVTKLKVFIENYSLLPKIIRIGFLMTSIAVGIHWITCGWMVITPKPEMSSFDMYVHSLYWCFTTLTTVGYGDITPQNNLGKIYASLTMILGVGAFGVIISNLSRFLMLNDRYKEEKKEKMNNLHMFLKHYAIPDKVQSQVYTFYNHLLEKKVSENDNQILSELPPALQEELRIYMKIKMIRGLEVFQNIPMMCLKTIAHRLEQKFYSPGDVIFKTGDQGSEMYIIGHGTVEIMINQKIVSILNPGNCFGEMALMDGRSRMADSHAQDYCDLYVFHQKDFDELKVIYPDLNKRFNDIYEKRKLANLQKVKKSA
jgi:hypothetical protein